MVEDDPMDTNLDDEPPIDQSRAQELGTTFERFVIGAVATRFEINPGNLELLHHLSAELLDRPGNVYFRVLDRPGNTMYGVVAKIQEDGTLADYRCGIIPL